MCEVSVCCEVRGEVPEPASYTKALKNSIKSHTFLSHGREQTHLPFRSMDVMSAQPWDGLLRHSSVLFPTEAMMKGSTSGRVRVPEPHHANNCLPLSVRRTIKLRLCLSLHHRYTNMSPSQNA